MFPVLRADDDLPDDIAEPAHVVHRLVPKHGTGLGVFLSGDGDDLGEVLPCREHDVAGESPELAAVVHDLEVNFLVVPHLRNPVVLPDPPEIGQHPPLQLGEAVDAHVVVGAGCLKFLEDLRQVAQVLAQADDVDVFLALQYARPPVDVDDERLSGQAPEQIVTGTPFHYGVSQRDRKSVV